MRAVVKNRKPVTQVTLWKMFMHHTEILLRADNKVDRTLRLNLVDVKVTLKLVQGVKIANRLLPCLQTRRSVTNNFVTHKCSTVSP